MLEQKSVRRGAGFSALIVVVAFAFLVSAASAKTVKLGSANAAAGKAAGNCSPGYSWVQVATASTSPSYRAPSAGTIISWTTSAETLARAALKVWRATSTPLAFKPVAQSATKKIPGTGTLTTFATSIPVKKGDVIGIASISGEPDCLQMPPYAMAGDDAAFTSGDPTSGKAPFTDYGTYRLNLSVKFKH